MTYDQHMTTTNWQAPWGTPKPAPTSRLIEHYRVDHWTLQAFPEDHNPTNYHLRSDRPGLPKHHGVTRNLHTGWTIHDGDTTYTTWDGPLACLQWWADRRANT